MRNKENIKIILVIKYFCINQYYFYILFFYIKAMIGQQKYFDKGL